jgi:hypothetical protein
MRTAAIASVLTGLLAAPLPAQLGSALARAVPFQVAPVPFGPGEVQRYKVEWGVFGEVGTSRLEVAGIDTVHGYPTYHLNWETRGKVKLTFVTVASVNDLLQSWLDVSSLISRRFDQNQHEVKYRRHRILEFLPDQMRWQRTDKEESGELASPLPLDEVSFLYFARTLPLEPGETYTFDRYWEAKGNPVVIRVLRRDTITIEGVEYPTIAVQPIIQTKGMFSEGGEAEVHFSDDSRRLIVFLRASLSIATMKMSLTGYSPGEQLVSGIAPAGSQRED